MLNDRELNWTQMVIVDNYKNKSLSKEQQAFVNDHNGLDKLMDEWIIAQKNAETDFSFTSINAAKKARYELFYVWSGLTTLATDIQAMENMPIELKEKLNKLSSRLKTCLILCDKDLNKVTNIANNFKRQMAIIDMIDNTNNKEKT